MVSKGIIFLVVFTPFAFGTVEPWSISIMELAVFGLFLFQTGTEGRPLPGSRPARAVLVLFLFLVGLVLLQLLPLPDSVLGLVSPAARATWRHFGSGPPGAFHPLSICPDATIQELLRLLAYAAAFIVVARHCRTRARALLLAKTILLTGGALAVQAILQKATWNGRLLWFYPVEESLRSGSRIWGPYVNHNHFAGYLELALPLGLGLLIHAAPAGRPAPGGGWSGRLGRFLSGRDLVPLAAISLLVLLMSACLFATLSRGAILGSAVASLAFMGMIWRRSSLRRGALVLALAAAAFCAAVLLPAWDRIARRFEDLEEKNQVSRLYVLNDSLGILRDFPLSGTGLGTFEQGYRRYQTRYPTLSFDHAHNDYLEVATDTGAAGFLLVAGMAATFFVSLSRGWKRRHNRFSACIGAGGICSSLALAVHSGTDFNLHIPANALLFAMIAGLTHAVVFSHAGRGETPRDQPPPRRTPSFARSLWVIPLAGLLVYLPARTLLADYRHQRVARILDDPATAELDVKPIAADTMASFLEAVDSLKEAAAREPSRAAHPQALSELHATLGAWALAMESLQAPLPAGAPSGKDALALAIVEAKRAISLDPTSPDLHLALGRLYAAVDGDLGRANAEIRLALAAHPASARILEAAAMIYLLDGRRASALELAGTLARLDDGYLSAESLQKTYQVESRARPYLSRLKSSYLFRALEIAWRASGEDAAVTAGVAPLNGDAREVLQLFFESKGREPQLP